MNKTFGMQLRQQLIQFMANSKSMRDRAQSTSSSRLSLDSLEGTRLVMRNDHDKLGEMAVLEVDLEELE
jgi:hypothetical protein